MAKYFWWTTLVFCLLVTLLSFIMLRGNSRQTTHLEIVQNQMTKFDIKLDRDSAIKIAEIILLKAFGEEVLDQRPWVITESDLSVTLEGRLPPQFDKGGVALIEISRKNAEVLRITHGK